MRREGITQPREPQGLDLDIDSPITILVDLDETMSGSEGEE